jgi:hypothetical protein
MVFYVVVGELLAQEQAPLRKKGFIGSIAGRPL